MYTVPEDMMRGFYQLLYLAFCIKRSVKSTVQQMLYWQFVRYFYLKIIVSVISANLDTNLFLFLFCLSVEFKKEWNFQPVGGLVTRNNFHFGFKASHALLESHNKFKRYLWRSVFVPFCIIVPCLNLHLCSFNRCF